MNNNAEITGLQNRLRDLADRSYNQNIFTFSQFLSLGEMDAFYKIEKELGYASPCLFGGYEGAERNLIRFGNPEDLGFDQEPPIVCIHISPLMEKFADKLSHRDFLGALMNLGIERDVLGDIKTGEKEAYLFCLDSISEFICDSLDKVKHTNVKCKVVDAMAELPEEEPEEISVLVSSERADGIISKVCKLSRSDSLDLFREGKVFINGRLCENNSKPITKGDTINARGYGKFTILSEPNTTKKGKLNISVAVYR
jgi:RNA-binding protein YlmH